MQLTQTNLREAKLKQITLYRIDGLEIKQELLGGTTEAHAWKRRNERSHHD